MSSELAPNRSIWRFSLWHLLALAAALGALVAQVQNTLHVPKEEQAHYDIVRRQQELKAAIIDGLGADQVRQVVESGANLWVGMDDGSAPFLCAITLGRLEAVQVMLGHVEDVEQIGRYSNHPGKYKSADQLGPALFAAVDCDQLPEMKIQMIKLLLARGANIRRENGNINLMDLAAFRGDEVVGDFLRSHGLPYGPREMAAFNRIEELKQAIQEFPDLLHERFKPIGLSDVVGWRNNVSTLLGIALGKNHHDMARMLIENGAPLDALESHGRTPLHVATTFNGDSELIRLLIAHGADVNALDDDQLTPLASCIRDWGNGPERDAARSALMEAGAK